MNERLSAIFGEREPKRLFLAAVLVLVIMFFPEARGVVEEYLVRERGTPPPTNESGETPIRRVIDGDTFEIDGGERVRLIGVDAPESVKPGSPVECFGREASRFLKERLEGKSVRLERDVSDRDRYGRLLRYAYEGDVVINEELVRAGYGTAVSFPPDVRELERLRSAEAAARREQVGLWNEAICPPESL